MKLFKSILFVIVLSVSLSAIEVSLVSKNVYIKEHGRTTQLTSSANVSYPTLSPDEKSLVYIRTIS
jgi:hypothetical protein